ncbi:group I truncated hemoglobin [Natronospira bacteriovora]|uniref:group I truncated hemoglobin n=1 Tax=Natronospira bacteriovora TaxID=3069753 RepID=UPI0040413B08
MKRLSILAVFSALVLAGCVASPEPAEDDRLYQALGEREGIERIVEDMLIRVTDDVRIAHYFRGIPLGDLRDELADQFCELAGGPCEYTGRDMREAHEDLDLSRADFNALVEHLIAAMERHHVRVPDQNRLLAKLAPMERDMVD